MYGSQNNWNTNQNLPYIPQNLLQQQQRQMAQQAAQAQAQANMLQQIGVQVHG